jgi:hypothetical protein
MSELDDLRQSAARKLDAQAQRARMLQSYYDNEAGIIALLDSEERRTFKTFLSECGADWCQLVVNAVAERLQVVGFRFGDQAANDAAWELWQASSMDADAELVQTDALTMGSSFVLVQPDEDNPTGVSITPESPLQATVLYEPGSRRKRIAGYKRYAANGDDYLLTGYSALAASAGAVEVLITPEQIITWRPGSSNPQAEPNPAGVVGLVELVPNPRTLGPPRSELDPARQVQDRINTTIFNRLVATDFGAFRTIYATGVKIAQQVIKGTDGGTATRVVAPFQIGANRLLTNEDPAGKFGSIPESTLSGYLASVEQDVIHLGAVTQTPPHYLLTRQINLSADAIKASEAGLVAKVSRRARHLGEGWEEVARIALQLTGNLAATNTSAEVVWADFETRSQGQLVDALTKMATLGVPQQVLWQRWGATPQEITAWLGMSDRAPFPPAPGPAPAPAPEPVPVDDGSASV